MQPCPLVHTLMLHPDWDERHLDVCAHSIFVYGLPGTEACSLAEQSIGGVSMNTDPHTQKSLSTQPPHTLLRRSTGGKKRENKIEWPCHSQLFFPHCSLFFLPLAVGNQISMWLPYLLHSEVIYQGCKEHAETIFITSISCLSARIMLAVH